MRQVTYYLRDGKQPVTTIVLLQDEETNNIVRGVAICNPCENFEKEFGRTRAFDRAVKSSNSEKSFGKIRRKDILVDKNFKYKCEWMPKLTEYEENLLRDPVDK